MNKEIESLEEKEIAAEQAVGDLARKRTDAIDAAVQNSRRSAEKRWDDEFGEQLNALRTAWHESQDALTIAKESKALSGKGAPYPIGTELFEWKSKKSGWRFEPLSLSGRMGIVEAVTRESQHPDNKQYGRAEIGDFVIRIIKKDGTKSKDYHTFSGWKSKWLPKGKTPKNGE